MQKLLPLSLPALLLAGCIAASAPSAGGDVSPASVQADARTRLAGDPVTARAALAVTVSDGVATLSGPVLSEAVRQRALQLVKGTPGVFAVEDRTFRQ